jgi:hypothetical protein
MAPKLNVLALVSNGAAADGGFRGYASVHRNWATTPKRIARFSGGMDRNALKGFRCSVVPLVDLA